MSKLLACTPPITLFRQKHKRRISWIRGNPAELYLCRTASSEHSRVSSVRANVSGCCALSRLSFTFHGSVSCLLVWRSLMFIFHSSTHWTIFGVRRISALLAWFKPDRCCRQHWLTLNNVCGVESVSLSPRNLLQFLSLRGKHTLPFKCVTYSPSTWSALKYLSVWAVYGEAAMRCISAHINAQLFIR